MDTKFYAGEMTKALHGRLVGRFKPPLAGRCNDFAPSRQKNCHRQKQPSRPGPRKKKNTAPSRPVEKKKKSHPVPPRKKKKTAPSHLGKKKQPPRPASEKNNNRPVPPRKKKTTAPSRLEKKTNPPRPAMNSKIQNTPPRGWKLETNTTACLFFSFLLHIYILL